MRGSSGGHTQEHSIHVPAQPHQSSGRPGGKRGGWPRIPVRHRSAARSRSPLPPTLSAPPPNTGLAGPLACGREGSLAVRLSQRAASRAKQAAERQGRGVCHDPHGIRRARAARVSSRTPLAGRGLAADVRGRSVRALAERRAARFAAVYVTLHAAYQIGDHIIQTSATCSSGSRQRPAWESGSIRMALGSATPPNW